VAADRNAFVTGASGFVGGALTRSLIADGWSVRALARSEPAAAKVAGLGAEPVRGDVGSASAISAGAQGCSLAFHAAALAAQWGTREEFELVNVVGTANALSGCADAGVRRFVHVGTEAALLDGEPLVNVDETAPLRPDAGPHYPATKARAELLVTDASRPGFETVVLRPRLVWGPGDETILPPLKAAVESGRFAWIGGGRHLTSTTHIDNAVHGLRLAAERGRPGRAYFVTDGEPVVFREFITELLATQGVDPGTRSIPRPVASGVAVACEATWRALPLRGEPPLTRLAVWLAGLEATIDISRARDELGYEPVTTIAEGMAGLRTAGG
jgi:nucleoside-diphosphate-sugar epimerase